MGGFICVHIIINNILTIVIKHLISGNSLFKILILRVFSEAQKCYPYFWFTRPIFLLNIIKLLRTHKTLHRFLNDVLIFKSYGRIYFFTYN